MGDSVEELMKKEQELAGDYRAITDYVKNHGKDKGFRSVVMAMSKNAIVKEEALRALIKTQYSKESPEWGLLAHEWKGVKEAASGCFTKMVKSGLRWGRG